MKDKDCQKANNYRLFETIRRDEGFFQFPILTKQVYLEKMHVSC